MPQDESSLPPASFEMPSTGMADASRSLDGLVGVTTGFSSALLHDLRQPVSAILFNALAALRLVRKDESLGQSIVEESLKDIIAEVDRLKTLLQGFGTYLGLGGDDLPGVDVNQTVTAALGLLAGESVRRQMRLSTDLGHDLPVLKISPSLLTRAIIALALDLFQTLEAAPADLRDICVQTGFSQGYVNIGFQAQFMPIFSEKSPSLPLQFQALGVQTLSSHDPHGKMTWGIMLAVTSESVS